jgi:hypothetical protein
MASMKLRAATMKNTPRQTNVEADIHHNNIGRIAKLRRKSKQWL